MDTFTCGSCKASFTDLQEFLNHKNTLCCQNAEQPHPAPPVKVTSSLTGSLTSIAENESIGDAIADTDSPPVTQNKDLLKPETEDGAIFLCKDCNIYATDITDLKRHHSELHDTLQDSAEGIIVRLQPLSGAKTVKTCSAEAVSTVKRKRGRSRKYPRVKNIPFTKTRQVTEDLIAVSAVKGNGNTDDGDEGKMPRRKRGRPRKTKEEKDLEKKRLLERLEEEEREKHQTVECQSCGKVFARLRQLVNHRCQADNPDSDRDSITEGDENDSVTQTGDGTVESETLQFDLESIRDGQNLPQKEIPQVLTDEALPDLPVSNSDNLKVHPCPVCGKVFKAKSPLVIHLGMHSKNRPFKCTECIYSSKYKSNLTVHLKKHTNQRLHCDIYDYSCTSKGMLKDHKKKYCPKQKLIYCDLCNCRQYTTPNLLCHLEAEHNIETDDKAKSYYKEQKLLRRIGQQNLIYKCHICHRKFKDRNNHDQHLILHQPNKPFQCTMCPYTAFRYTAIEKHARRHWFIYICHLCKTKVLSLELLEEHLTSHDLPDGISPSDFLELSIGVSMYQSDPIDKELVSEHSRKNEIRLDESKIPSPVETANFLESEENDLENCEIINRSEYLKTLDLPIVDKLELQEIGEAFTKLCFKRLSLDLLREIRSLYGSNECPICGRLFSYRPHLETHKKTHQNEKDFKCELCSYSSHTKQGLKRHVDTVHIRTKLKCPTCDFETTSSVYLQAHLKKHQGPQAFKCTQCDWSTAMEGEMKLHIVTNHPELHRSELEKIMGKHIHMRNKIGRIASHRCQLCGQVFRRLCDLRAHIWQHNGINPYKCTACKFEARNLSNLKSHMLRHSNVKNHLCDECGKMFKMKNGLKVHQIAQHPNAKLHCCTHCEFTTNKESQLKHHMDIHIQLPVQTFRCYHCTQYTSDKDSLREHYRMEHPDTIFDETSSYEIPEERITTLNISINHKDGVLHYKCSQCDVILVNNGELGQHLRETHGLAITTSMEGDGETGHQLDAGNLSKQTDVSTLSQGLEVHMIDAMSDERANAMQLLQQIVDIQAATAQNEHSVTEPSQQQYTTEDNNQDAGNVGITETVAAVEYLTTSETLNDVHDGMQHTEQNLQAVESGHYVTGQPNTHDGSSEVITDGVFEQGSTLGDTVEPEGQMTYVIPGQQSPSS